MYQIIEMSTFTSLFIFSCGSGFLCMTHTQNDSPLADRDSIYTVTELTIIVMPGCKCQCIFVSWPLLGSMCQHLIEVSACKGPRRLHRTFYPCLHLKRTVAQQDCTLRSSTILLILFYFINTDSFLSVSAV